jgi:hypothetical protein
MNNRTCSLKISQLSNLAKIWRTNKNTGEILSDLSKLIEITSDDLQVFESITKRIAEKVELNEELCEKDRIDALLAEIIGIRLFLYHLTRHNNRETNLDK